VGETFKKERWRRVQISGNFQQERGADTKRAILISPKLLNRHAKLLAQPFTRYAQHAAPHQDAAANMYINRVSCRFRHLNSILPRFGLIMEAKKSKSGASSYRIHFDNNSIDINPSYL
jgi:hypothetical protein